MMTFIVLMMSLALRISGNPEELGDVQWLRSMDAAVTAGKKEGKPILILFQEVPGCHTCKKYGNEVLSHPLIVEAIETHFIPLAIYNNKSGHDAEILKKFNEPAWNNPVVRIVDASGKEVTPRLSGNYSAAGLTSAMVSGLIQTKGQAPLYLQLLADELAARSRGTQTATYSMHCFWTGEALFGKTNGVIATTAGWQLNKEVVRVEFDPGIITKAQLDKIADQSKCRILSGGEFNVDRTPKYYLSQHHLKNVPMTELQKARVNSAIGEGIDPLVFLSPKQLEFAKRKTAQNFVSVDLLDAWTQASQSGKSTSSRS